jgi:hypothetical protein
LVEGHLLGDEPEVEPGGRQLVLHAVALLVDLKVIYNFKLKNNQLSN